MSPIEVEWDPRHRHRKKPPSRVHGLWDQFRGRIMGKEHLIHRGERETRRARQYNDAVREARKARRIVDEERRREERQREGRRRRQRVGVGFPFFGLGRGYRTKVYRNGEVEVEQITRDHPWLHPDKRCLPWYHGFYDEMMGFITGDKSRRSKGRSMREHATRERHRERRHRLRELRQFSQDMRTRSRHNH
ncbi:hypothetical protein SISSUDRAFT_929967 [Sistotremastrum suecicum HHB10207 ss-3]|uniref:Uncharacterized protein n=1 Tax=Sistotremastrum suecicum HHB10207 ss-3 TaxID=1314776 RepID=A0A166BT52_9AGAM|nr:hypothetical protein SISSUDRAFT_929967 [Sistotremastrum suecicum HHB10207 ss-3]